MLLLFGPPAFFLMLVLCVHVSRLQAKVQSLEEENTKLSGELYKMQFRFQQEFFAGRIPEKELSHATRKVVFGPTPPASGTNTGIGVRTGKPVEVDDEPDWLEEEFRDLEEQMLRSRGMPIVHYDPTDVSS